MSMAKSTAANGSLKVKNSKGSAHSTRSSTPVPTAANQDTSDVTSSSGKPDKVVYDAEQEKIKADIDALQLKLSTVKDKLALSTKSGPGNDRRTALRAELDSIRAQQSENKAVRSKIMERLKAIQESIQKRSKELQSARSKTTFRTVADVDVYIKNLEKQVESGKMTVVEEKRALQEISQCKRTRRTIEGFQESQISLEADRAAADELRKQLDDPQSKAASERYEVIRAELDDLKKEGDEVYNGRMQLAAERDALQNEINTLFTQKRQSVQNFRDANDRYWNKINEERAKRAERLRAQRAAEEAEKKRAAAERLREDAALPAYQSQIEDCQTLIDFFSVKSGGGSCGGNTTSLPLSTKTDLEGVPKLELRKVEADPADGLVARKKKGEDDDAYFIGKGKTKGRKGGVKSGEPLSSSSDAPSTTSTQLNVPLPTLSALLSLSIPPPTSSADVSRVVEDLKTKKAWFEANQESATAENVSKAEANIRRLADAGKNDYKPDATPSGDADEHQGEPITEGVPAQPAPENIVD